MQMFDNNYCIVSCSFQDHVVREARGQGARTDNLNDFNPFAADQGSTVVCTAMCIHVWHTSGLLF